MKNTIFAFFSVILFSMVSCQDELIIDDSSLPKGKGITFHISTQADESEPVTRNDVADNRVVSLRYLLADAAGKVLTHYQGQLSESFDRLDINDLKAGNYTIVFLGSSCESDLACIEAPSTLEDTWLQNIIKSKPIEGSYFFKKIDFTIGERLEPKIYDVVLERALSRIKVEFPGLPSAVEALISSVTLTLEEGGYVYSSIKADCSFSGEATISNCELCDSSFKLTLNTLPSTGPLSGTVKVKATTLSGDSLSTTYRFSDLTAEAGKVNRIAINLRHPDFKTGFIRIRPKDYFDYDADLMLMEDEPAEVLHDITQRHFWVTDPLSLKTYQNQLRVQLYSAVPASEVDIYANFPNLGIDSVHMVHFDKVEALLEMLVPMSFTKREAQYYDIHGKRVTIPKMDIPSNIEWFVRSEDTFLTRMSKLNFKNWNVSFPNWENIWPSKAIVPDPKCMRHALIQMINLALTFDSEEFAEEIAAHEGEYHDSGINYSNKEIIERIHNNNGCNYGLGACNTSSGFNGWGGGRDSGFITLIVNQQYFANMYPTEDPDTPCNRERECFYHEHSHCLGFTHEGNMTYNGVWTNTVGTAYLRAYKSGKIFFYSPDFIENIPYKRSEAPAWTTKGLVEKR